MKKILTIIMFLAFSGHALADWRYAQTDDKMTGKSGEYAELESNNSLQLEFPYTGKNYGRIAIRRHPRFGTNAFVLVDKGQIQCASYDECHVLVKFDDAAPIKWSVSKPEDHSTDVVFFNNEKSFIAKAKKAKRILVSIVFFRSGSQILEFYTSKPLEWK